MKEEDIQLLKDDGWIVECESPFEIRQVHGGGVATGYAASIILDTVLKAERKRLRKYYKKHRKTCGNRIFFQHCPTWKANDDGCASCRFYDKEAGAKLDKVMER